MWKTREDQLPPPSYFSMVVAYLQKAYKDARVSRELMDSRLCGAGGAAGGDLWSGVAADAVCVGGGQVLRRS